MPPNPWLRLPSLKPFVLESDANLLQRFNETASEKHKYDLSLFPEPFFGSLTAPVVILALNPGLSTQDAATHALPWFAEQALSSLAHALAPYPFLHLQPITKTPGGNWWAQRTRQLVCDLGFEVVSTRIACVQYMPYHSQEYSARTPLLPSQQYGFFLVRQAIARGAEIVVLRSLRLWMMAVPELASYERVHIGRNPRAPYITKGNMKSAYEHIAERLRGEV
jgi:hypothetical protein